MGHQFRWELQLILDGEFERSQVCRTQDDVFGTVEVWRAALHEKGWARRMANQLGVRWKLAGPFGIAIMSLPTSGIPAM